MPKPTNLYIDSDGVKRGYYVYLHKDRVTGEVFYVGKGHGRRAWNSNQRHYEWIKKVELLSEGWDVEIVQDNLTEIEAFELEAELVENYGGAATNGGALTNWLPGGEHPEAIKFGLQFDDKGWSAAYYGARNFKALMRQQQEAIATSVAKKLEPIVDQLSNLEDQADENEDDKLDDSASNIESIILSVLNASSDLLRRRVSWKEFCFTLEEVVDDLESEMEDVTDHHPEVIPLLEKALVVTKALFVEIDSGNRTEAEEFANKAVREK